MKKTKVVHITQSVIGGTLEYIKLLFKYMDKSKYDLELICPSYGPMMNEITKMGFKVIPLEMNREINIVNDYRGYKKLVNILRERKAEIVHCHSSKAGVIGRAAAHKLKIPCVYNAHGWSFSMNVTSNKRKLYSFIERVSAKYCDKIVNISEYEQRLAVEYKIASQKKMIVINNGIDISKYEKKFDRNNVLEELNLPKNAYIIGMVGRLTKQKSPETFIKVAKKLVNKIDNVYFIFIGDGELRGEVEKLLHDNNLSNRFRITGWTNEVNKYVYTLDIGLLTSIWEGFGLVLAEYMAAKKPIVASNVGGIPNVVKNGYDGFLVNPNDVDEFANRIIEIYSNDAIKEKFIKNGYKEVIEKFAIQRVADEHDKIYDTLIER